MMFIGIRKIRRKVRVVLIGVLACLYITGSFMLKAELENALANLQLRNVTGNFITSEVNGEYCFKEQTNFVFIKCMKCATESLGTVFRRFGYTRHLNFALPGKRNIYLGWPFPFEKQYVRPSKTKYNILFEHSVYNGPVMKSVMANDTVFITMIRSPWEQFKSSFNYFRLGDISGLASDDDMNEYLSDIEQYEEVYKSSKNNEKRWCFPDGFSMTRNILSHCLGMPLGFPKGREDISEDPSAVASFIKHLDENFLFIMIADYFYESLVLLKRLMCWSLKDIVFRRANINSYKFKSVPAEGKYFEIHRNWSRIDYLLFEHFNTTFWKKVANQGPDFKQEVDHFRLVHLVVDRFCFVENSWLFPTKYLTIPSSQFNPVFNVSGEECSMMTTYMLPMLWERYYQDEGLTPESFKDVNKRPKPPIGCSI